MAAVWFSSEPEARTLQQKQVALKVVLQAVSVGAFGLNSGLSFEASCFMTIQ